MADADAWARIVRALAGYFGFNCRVIAVKVSETKALGERGSRSIGTLSSL